jgi:uncharacterized protein YjiK
MSIIFVFLIAASPIHMSHSSHTYLSRYCFHVMARLGSGILLMIHLSFCNPHPEAAAPNKAEGFLYDLESPDARYKLPDYLEEISGLSYISKGKLACVQDEKALIYMLNLEQEKVVKKYDFGKDADYEDIAVVDKTAYVLRNDGDIYRIEDFRKKGRKVRKFETPLKEKNDTEGLAYDPVSSSLLIACKGSPSIDKDQPYEGYKAIYKFDLEEEELLEDPYLLIDLEGLSSYRDLSSFKRFSLRVAKGLRMIESETSFQPSGLAIHPVHGEFYIISSVGKLLIILDREGNVQDVKELDPKLFRQPEGICFSPDGDMYISNEGQGGKGYILKFNIHATRE